MAFSFGSTFTGTPQKPTGFGTAFGATTTSTQPANFGFGQAQTTQPAFGFGTTTTPSTLSTFGTSTFGMPTASAAPAFGAATATPSFGFGTAQQPQATGLFGATAATTKPTLFGTPTPAQGTTGGLFSSAGTTTPSLFGSTVTTTPSLFGTVQPVQSTPSLFGSTTPAPSLFSTPATTTPSLFGQSFGQTPGSFGGFGTTTQTSAPSLFGSTFRTTATTTTPSFGGFGTSTTFSGFGSTVAPAAGGLFAPKPVQTAAAQPGQQMPHNLTQQVVASVYSINIFNDERDDILKKWNMLQACWGVGKGYCNPNQPPVEYNPQNPYYRFKAIGYNIIPDQDNSEGMVKLVFNKKVEEIKTQQEVFKNGIAAILGNRPNLIINILSIRSISDTQTEIKISVLEKGVTGTSRKIPATDLAAFLNQPTQKQQFSNVGVSLITPFVTPSKTELEDYLRQPPPGIDQQMWQAGIQDNPNPKKYIAVPIKGFSDLRTRMLNQEYQTGLHSAFLENVNKEIAELKTKHAASIAQINESKQKYLELQHRILRVLVKQESIRKMGLAIQPEEEILRGRLEMIRNQLNIPTQYKGQMNELLSHVRMIENSQTQNESTYRMDVEAQDEIKQFLKMEQDGIAQLINVVNDDLKAVKIISEGLKDLVDRRRYL